ncbi:MAG: outer membrane lipoprotein chaperone LolA [Proteobacteria bacterium]|jgi:outer membrane lipoprotein carrier protein|nr:outer membrane lipoprotein chaperone LolA [Pseudomonadota bacterium]
MRKEKGKQIFWIGGVALAAAFLWFQPAAAGEAPKLKDLVQKLQERYEGVKTMVADFEQVSRVANVQGSFSGRGRVFFQKPGKMRWEYKIPDKQYVVCDGEKIWFYRPKDGQVLVDKVNRAFSGKTPVNFLMGIGQIQEDFNLQLLSVKGEKEGNYFELEMTPKENLADVKKIVLQAGRGDFLVRGIKIYDFFLNQNEIKFTKVKTNPSLAEKVFTFTPPKGAKVVEPPQFPATPAPPPPVPKKSEK